MPQYTMGPPSRPRRVTMEAADVPLEGGATLRVGLEYDSRSRPAILHLAAGVGEGDGWRETVGAAGIGIPPDRIGDLIRVLVVFLDRVR
jgi:hypothetical protein